MGYCDHEKNKWYKNERNSWDKGFSSFIESDNAWKYDFELNGEASKADCEASFLSQIIFEKLFMKTRKMYADQGCSTPIISGLYEDGISINIRKGDINKQFLFDVMNNPNKSHQPYEQADFTKYLQKGNDLVFKKLYHSVGNFAPIPRTVISKNYGQNLQFIHNDLNELWPWFLKFLRDNWEEFPTKIHKVLSFNEYMKYTCQQMYFDEPFETVCYCMEKENIEWEKIFKYLCKYKIKENEALISFNDLLEKGKIEEVDKRISFLIELRGRYIIDILNIRNRIYRDKHTMHYAFRCRKMTF